MKLKPYPKYRDSGIQWIGEIPEGWEVNRLKFLLSSLESGSRETGGGSQLDEGVFSLGGEHINWDGTLNLENTKLISEEYYNSMNQGKLKINDVLLVKDGATIGKTAILTKKEFDKMAVNEHVFLMRSNKMINPKLLYYLICSDSGFKQIKLTEVGSAQGGINQDFIAKAYFSIPQDKQDQNAIANFLDKKNARIDALIEKDKRLIELLKERRTALINHAVTKGLDPNVKLKDSGIDWIGEIPEGWDVIKIKHIAGSCSMPVQTGPFGAQLHADDYVNEGIPFILIRNVNHGKINNTNIPFVSEEDAERLFMYRLKADDIVFSRVGSLGRAALVTNREEGWLISGQMLRLRLKDKRINRNYLVYLFQSKVSEEYVSYESVGSTRESLNTEILSNFISPLPPLPDQTAIANFLDQATSKIDKTIKLIEKKIKLLEEYKKSLIHYVVTGKIDVRGVEA